MRPLRHSVSCAGWGGEEDKDETVMRPEYTSGGKLRRRSKAGHSSAPQGLSSGQRSGCLDAVAKAARSPKTITAMVLRDVLLGSAVLEMKDWLKIGRALDRLTEKAAGG